jgi:hypothetical protein
MPSESRPPNWGRVWLEARAAGRNPLSALVAAGLAEAAAVTPPEPRGPSRPPPGDPPRRRLKCHEGLDPERLAQVEAELAARASPPPAPVPAPVRLRRIAEPIRRLRPHRRRQSGPARRAAG